MININVKRTNPKEMWFHVTFRCNLSCSHCLFECSSSYTGFPDMTTEAATRHATGAAAHGITNFYITGGEPLLWQPLRDFISQLDSIPETASITLLTNGALIDEGWAAFFGGCEKLSLRISLECYTEQTNDAYRGEGSFIKAVSGIKELNKRGVFPWICYTSKNGGKLNADDTISLENDFKAALHRDHAIKISGLKVLGLYNKGRSRERDTSDSSELPPDYAEKLAEVQCAYGLAAGPVGIVPCPILVDTPEAKLSDDFQSGLRADLELTHDCCADCLKTGSTCGQ